MKRPLLACLLFVVGFHLAVFVAEALLWMLPVVYARAIPRISPASTLGFAEHAALLRPVLLNQGFYNLFLAVAGMLGLRSIKRGAAAAGLALVSYMCLSALGAGIVLALSTRAYLGAVLQSVPAALALVSLRHAPLTAAKH